MYSVYILMCDDMTYYVGITHNLTLRLAQHRGKQSFFTKRFQKIDLVYSEKYPTRELAHKREKQLQGWSRSKKRALINKTLFLRT